MNSLLIMWGPEHESLQAGIRIYPQALVMKWPLKPLKCKPSYSKFCSIYKIMQFPCSRAQLSEELTTLLAKEIKLVYQFNHNCIFSSTLDFTLVTGNVLYNKAYKYDLVI